MSQILPMTVVSSTDDIQISPCGLGGTLSEVSLVPDSHQIVHSVEVIQQRLITKLRVLNDSVSDLKQEIVSIICKIELTEIVFKQKNIRQIYNCCVVFFYKTVLLMLFVCLFV